MPNVIPDLVAVLDQIVTDYPEQAIWVAYSGGVDSHVLLHLLACCERIARSRLHAIHIDHDLDPESGQWAQHCEQIASDLGVQYQSVTVTVTEQEQLGIERAAREARYRAFANTIPAGAVVLTAQHADDQAETVLLQLLRGAGVKGLAAMATERTLDDKRLVRPLLAVSQATILAYAEQHQLEWIEDPSNRDIRLNRNYLRQIVWPSVLQRWPAAANLLGRSASHCAESDALLAELAVLDLSAVDIDLSRRRLPLSVLLPLPDARRRNVLRYLITQWQWVMPSTVVMQRLLDEVCWAAEDSVPEVAWADVVVRRYRDELYFLSSAQPVRPQLITLLLKPEPQWLTDGCQLTWQVTTALGISDAMFEKGLCIAFRQGGEVIQLAGHDHHKKLKQLFQDWAIPPWQRDQVPLIYCGDTLVAVVGYGMSVDCVLADGEQGYLPVLQSSQ